MPIFVLSVKCVRNMEAKLKILGVILAANFVVLAAGVFVVQDLSVQTAELNERIEKEGCSALFVNKATAAETIIKKYIITVNKSGGFNESG